ncbi:MAG: tetratricopeptide repeat protein [Alphaproteobacteria bacterium]|nr:tetratricopeptide repeat protein [Alphaproteobacteria bacterium]
MLRALAPKAPGSSAALPAEDIVKETRGQAFMKDVIETSLAVPVLAHFSATGSATCKQFMPVLEKAVRAMNGRVGLVHVNIDENQMVARQLGIQTVPTVFIFLQGQPVDGFAGVLPEKDLKALLEKLAGPSGEASPEEALKLAQEKLHAKDFEGAVEAFEAIVIDFPESTAAIAGLARSYLGLNRADEAKALLEGLEEVKKKEPEIQSVLAAIALAEETKGSQGNIDDLAAKVAVNPNDHESRFALAVAWFAEGKAEAAIEELIELLKRDREWNEQAARAQLVKIFDALGADHPLTLKGRRKMSSVYFS